jgi:aminoglycoside phosphotransferase (APT) family kinase protein
MDFHPKNVILTSDGPAVFDWGSFAVADPRSDVA